MRMEIIAILISSITAYLIGGIPTAHVVAKKDGMDILYTGSGETNVLGAIGLSDGTLVTLIDLFKGALPAGLCLYLLSYPYSAVLAAGLSTVLGHIYSPYLKKFRGGKGVAVGIGLLAVIFMPAVPFSFLLFTAVILISGYASLAAMVTYIALTPFYLVYTALTDKELVVLDIPFLILLTSLILLSHRKNIRRLLSGEEPKLSFRKGDKEKRMKDRRGGTP